MSVKAMAKVWDCEILTSTEKLVLLAYADHADHQGKNIYPAIDTIAKKASLNRRTVQRVTRQLVEMGLLVYDGDGPHGTNRWAIAMGQLGGGTEPPVAQGQGGGGPEYQKGRHRTTRIVLNHPLTNGGKAPQPYDVFLVWCGVLGFDPSRVSKTKKGQELKYAKELIDALWMPSEIQGCLQDLADQEYWQDKPLSLASVTKEINSWKQRHVTKRSIRM